ncbi:hypothetical protein FRC10_001152 [Ceratobasidium sp. 414]|nr:hypothetical protein FRC10_001152 [Ceratobasidium sp. 414]
MAGAAAASVVTQVEPDTQGPIPIFQPEPTLHEQGEVVPNPISPHALPPEPEPGHLAPALVLPGLALAPIPALPVVPAANVNLNVNPNPNPVEPTLLGSLNGVGGIHFAENEVPGNLTAEVPAGPPNDQEPLILLEDGMPNEAAFHAHQPFVPLQTMPVVAVVAQSFMPAADDNLAQPILRSLSGFEDIEFEDESEDEDQ